MVGAPGIPAGVTELLGEDAELVPILLVAVTVNVYAMPFVRPVMIAEVDAVVALKPPILDVTV